MKFLNFLIYLGICVTISLAAVETGLNCSVVQVHFAVCRQGCIMQSVKFLVHRNLNAPVDTHLSIKDTSISSIARDAFDDLDLTELSMELKNWDLSLEPESFNGLEMLESLNIISGIVTPTPNLFKSLKSLTHLALSLKFDGLKNLIKSLSSLKKLTSLSIFNTSFPTVTSNTFYNVNPTIKKLELHKNNISKIEGAAFYTMKSLEMLKIIDDHLVDFQPGALLGLTSLESLEIKHQPLTVIKKNTFINLNKLRSLCITYNMINKIESNAFSELSLRVLDLSNNAIATIEKHSFHSSNIDRLILSNNPIFKISESAFGNSHVIVMYLHNTTLQNINLNFWGMSENDTLVMSDSPGDNNSAATKV